jgi:hypothetical protein
MGFDIIRFVGEVDEELLCPICTGVLQDPVQVKIIYLSLPRRIPIFPLIISNISCHAN